MTKRQCLHIIQYLMHETGVNVLFDEIVHVLKESATVFDRSGQLVVVTPGTGVLPLTPQNLNGLLSTYLEIAYFGRKKNGDLVQKRQALLQRDFVTAFLHSPRVLRQFDKLQHYTRAPTFTENWRLVAIPGYHKQSQIYFDGPAIVPTLSTTHLEYVLSEFCWRSAADRTNYVGTLLTAITMPYWVGRHPMPVFSSNIPGTGKSLLARIIGRVIDGSCATVSFTADEAELERQLAMCVGVGDLVVIIDNAKTSARADEIRSGVLERCVTDATLNFRRLGTNTPIRRPNDVLFCVTANEARLGPDLRRRTIPIRLELFGDPGDRQFVNPDLEAYVVTHRSHVLAELVGMVCRWDLAGRPIFEDAARHSISQPWAATIDGILRVSGFEGFLANWTESSHEFDKNHEALSEVCALLHAQEPMTAGKWSDALLANGLLTDRLRDRRGTKKNRQARASIIGRLFTQYVGALFTHEDGTYRLCRQPELGAKSHVSPVFWFERVEEPTEA